MISDRVVKGNASFRYQLDVLKPFTYDLKFPGDEVLMIPHAAAETAHGPEIEGVTVIGYCAYVRLHGLGELDECAMTGRYGLIGNIVAVASDQDDTILHIELHSLGVICTWGW